MAEWKVNPDGNSITDPNGKVYNAGDEVTKPDGTIIMVKSDYEGIDDESLRKFVPDARSWNGVIVSTLNGKGQTGASIKSVTVTKETESTVYIEQVLTDETKIKSNTFSLPKGEKGDPGTSGQRYYESDLQYKNVAIGAECNITVPSDITKFIITYWVQFGKSDDEIYQCHDSVYIDYPISNARNYWVPLTKLPYLDKIVSLGLNNLGFMTIILRDGNLNVSVNNRINGEAEVMSNLTGHVFVIGIDNV